MKVQRKDNGAELLPIVNEQGKVIGKATRAECHGGSQLLHPVVHLHVFNSKGELYLQKRPAWKSIQPSKYDTAVGGHVSYGEPVPIALFREAREELGLTLFKPRQICTYVYENERERELIYVFTTTYDGAIVPSGELDGGRFWTLDEIRESLGTGVFTPNFEMEFNRFFSEKFA